MQKAADAVIIGGGVHGCSIAYHLLKYGYKNVVLLEKNTIGSGGTGRSAAGIRHQFGTEINIRLASASVKMMEQLEEELEYHYDIELMQKGYTMLAYTESQLEQFKTNVILQKKLDPDNQTVILSPEEIGAMLPLLSLDGVYGASFNPRDGHANPFHVTNAYAQAAKRLGAKVHNFQEVTAIKCVNDKVVGVQTNNGFEISTPLVINAAGPHGAIVGKMVGLDIPLYPERHQILVTEPLNMFLPSMVISFTHGTYFKQTPHGSLLMGVGDPLHEVKDFNERSTWQFLEDVARKITFHMPALKQARIVRQWAGLYDITPDHQAILGSVDQVEGYYHDVGWSGHGFQLGPIVGKIMAQMITGQQPDINVDVMHYNRFAEGKQIPEPACV